MGDYYATDGALVTGGWASPADVRRVLADVETIISGDRYLLEGAVVEATGQVQSLLRARYPVAWPWGTGAPPADVRGAVARVAAHSVALGRLSATAGSQVLETLRLERDAALRYIGNVVRKTAHPDLPTTVDRHRPAVSKPPGGEFGFKER